MRTGCTGVGTSHPLAGDRKHTWEHTWEKTAAFRLTPGMLAGSMDLAQPDEVMAAVSPVLLVRVTQSLWVELLSLADLSHCAAAWLHPWQEREERHHPLEQLLASKPDAELCLG